MDLVDRIGVAGNLERSTADHDILSVADLVTLQEYRGATTHSQMTRDRIVSCGVQIENPRAHRSHSSVEICARQGQGIRTQRTQGKATATHNLSSEGGVGRLVHREKLTAVVDPREVRVARRRGDRTAEGACSRRNGGREVQGHGGSRARVRVIHGERARRRSQRTGSRTRESTGIHLCPTAISICPRKRQPLIADLLESEQLTDPAILEHPAKSVVGIAGRGIVVHGQDGCPGHAISHRASARQSRDLVAIVREIESRADRIDGVWRQGGGGLRPERARVHRRRPRVGIVPRERPSVCACRHIDGHLLGAIDDVAVETDAAIQVQSQGGIRGGGVVRDHAGAAASTDRCHRVRRIPVQIEGATRHLEGAHGHLIRNIVAAELQSPPWTHIEDVSVDQAPKVGIANSASPQHQGASANRHAIHPCVKEADGSREGEGSVARFGDALVRSPIASVRVDGQATGRLGDVYRRVGKCCRRRPTRRRGRRSPRVSKRSRFHRNASRIPQGAGSAIGKRIDGQNAACHRGASTETVVPGEDQLPEPRLGQTARSIDVTGDGQHPVRWRHIDRGVAGQRHGRGNLVTAAEDRDGRARRTLQRQRRRTSPLFNLVTGQTTIKPDGFEAGCRTVEGDRRHATRVIEGRDIRVIKARKGSRSTLRTVRVDPVGIVSPARARPSRDIPNTRAAEDIADDGDGL